MSVQTVTASEVIKELEKDIEYYQTKVDQITVLKSKYIDKNADRLFEPSVQQTLRGLSADSKLFEDKIKSIQELIDKIKQISNRVSPTVTIQRKLIYGVFRIH